jgi:hypothetical protein
MNDFWKILLIELPPVEIEQIALIAFKNKVQIVNTL